MPRRPTRNGLGCLPRERASYTVTVCSACYRASCWQGYRYCDEARGASTTEATRIELKILDLENPHYWKTRIQL